jgi:predicted heme/steroid binding protein
MITFTPEQEQFMQLAQSRAYYQGRREGVSLYAHWRDGVQYVGTTGRTLKEALEYIDQDEAKVMARYNMLKAL